MRHFPKFPDGREVDVPCTKDEIDIIAEATTYTDWETWTDTVLEAHVRRVLRIIRLAKDADKLIDASGDTYYWVVPGMFEAGDRLVLTGTEGVGKSTLIMQWLVQISAGIHPLTLKPIEPQRVLLLDLEYGQAELARRLKEFKKLAGKQWEPGNVKVVSKSEGWDLLQPENQDKLRDLVKLWMPAIIGISPLYKAFEGDETDDVTANRLTGFLNDLRDQDPVIITEAHVPHAGPNGRRPERPIGSSVWTRWPEFGLFLASNGELRHFRGARDASREWPAALRRGGKWPWTALDEDQSEDVRWKKLKAWAVKNRKRPTTRQAAAVLGISQAQASRVMKAYENDWPVFSDSSDSS